MSDPVQNTATTTTTITRYVVHKKGWQDASQPFEMRDAGGKGESCVVM